MMKQSIRGLVLAVVVIATVLVAERAVRFGTLMVISIEDVPWRIQPKPSLSDYREMIETGALIGLTVDEAEALIGYRSRLITNPEWPIEFHLKHVDFFVWISAKMRDGFIAEAELVFD